MPEGVSRRRMLRASIGKVKDALDDFHGRPNFNLSGLGDLPDDDLERLIPVIMDASDVYVDGDQVVVRRNGQPPEVIFMTGSAEEDVWARIDGATCLGVIAQSLAGAAGERPTVTFNRVRALFLSLVSHGICVPRNPLR